MTTDEQSFLEEETLSTIEALKRQEQRYACHDYRRLHKEGVRSSTLESDRKLMLKWSYNVVDYFNLNREAAAIAMSYSDRFLQTSQGPEYMQDTDKYQLLCIVSLYLAVKVHDTATLTPKVFVDIGHGHYTEDEMEKMEQILLDALEWRVNPPTALGFVRLFLDLIPESELDHSSKVSAYLLARAQTERAVGDYKLLTVEPSMIAFVSAMNALEALGYCERDILMLTTPFSSCDCAPQDLTELRIRLCEAITFESSIMSLVPRTSDCPNKAPTKTKANNTNSLQESTTPRSVLCHA